MLVLQPPAGIGSRRRCGACTLYISLYIYEPCGGVPEWSNGAVSKTVVRLRTVGSNPTPSASYSFVFAEENIFIAASLMRTLGTLSVSTTVSAVRLGPLMPQFLAIFLLRLFGKSAEITA